MLQVHGSRVEAADGSRRALAFTDTSMFFIGAGTHLWFVLESPRHALGCVSAAVGMTGTAAVLCVLHTTLPPELSWVALRCMQQGRHVCTVKIVPVLLAVDDVYPLHSLCHVAEAMLISPAGEIAMVTGGPGCKHAEPMHTLGAEHPLPFGGRTSCSDTPNAPH